MEKVIHHIRKIRRQPEEVRRHILHVATLVCAAILIMLWFFSLGNNLVEPEREAEPDSALQPFSVLKDNIIGGYNSISDPSGEAMYTPEQ